MIPIGETLRRERLKRNLDLERISGELKIAPRFLEAIEDEQFDRLPGAVFAKSFVRQYAQFLGLEGEDLAGRVQQLIEPAELAPQFAAAALPNGIPNIHVPRMEEWERAGDSRFSWPSWIPAAGLLVLVMVVCSGIYAWWQRDRHVVTAQAPVQQTPVQQTPTTAAAQDPPPQPAPAVSAEPAQPAPSDNRPVAIPASVVPAPQTPPAQQTPPAGLPTIAPNPNATVHVALTAEEPVWVMARADGKYVFSGILEANQSRTVEATDTLTLRLGNAGGVNITLNGKPIGAVGPKGQARTLQFTSGGFQIVAAPKPSLPPAPI